MEFVYLYNEIVNIIDLIYGVLT